MPCECRDATSLQPLWRVLTTFSVIPSARVSYYATEEEATQNAQETGKRLSGTMRNDFTSVKKVAAIDQGDGEWLVFDPFPEYARLGESHNAEGKAHAM